MDYGQELRFGLFPTPNAANLDHVLLLAEVAEVSGLDLVTVQDHPYQARHVDAWTLLSVIAARSASLRVALNVANLPLRPPVVLAKSVATLDLVTGGRVDLGLGAGAFWDAIVAAGSHRLSAKESVDALEEGIEVIRGVWQADSRSVHLDGRHHRVSGLHPGPAPAHPVEIWLGAYKPRMLRLTGRLADGWIPSFGYLKPEAVADASARIDEAAERAGRDPAEIRRAYNFEMPHGDPAETIAGWATDLGLDTFVCWPSDAVEAERFAGEVVPAVRAAAGS